ncbi:MAG: outer membrane protein assembly factor BamB [Gammaproteobacteria bacterium]|nr:outer membrane protein assembly factor BamB [Gammaproteobacteria bacterium]
MQRYLKIPLLILFIMSLNACDSFGISNLPSPAPLAAFKPTVQVKPLWLIQADNGDGNQYLKFAIASDKQQLFTAGYKGLVSAVDARNGHIIWQHNLEASLTGGPGVGNGVVVVGVANGDVVALNQHSGKFLWATNVGNQLLAPPVIANSIVLVKTLNDDVVALEANSGKKLWQFAGSAPNMILRLGSSPQLIGNKAVIGFASGKLIVFNLQKGNILWQQPVAIAQGATAIAQMIDIDANPVVQNNIVYVATYQGNIAALRLSNGASIWRHKLSAYTGITVSNNNVFVTDANSAIWAFFKSSGGVNWRQQKLLHRGITAPVLMGNYLVFADAEGYLHWIAKNTGQLVARIRVSEHAILSTPVVNGDTVYALTTDGKLAAYRVI